RVAEGCTAAAIREIEICIAACPRGRAGFGSACIVSKGLGARERNSGRRRIVMRVAHFVQRYPPALGGSEAYFARLSRYLAAAGAAAARAVRRYAVPAPR